MWGFDRVGVVSVCNEGALSSGRVGNVCSGVCVSVCVCVCVVLLPLVSHHGTLFNF